MELTGTIVAGEATKTLGETRRRMGANRWFPFAVILPLTWGGMALGAWLGWEAGARTPGIIIGGLLGFGGGLLLVAKLSVSLFKKALIRRGLDTQHQLRVVLAPDAVTYELGEVALVARWGAITELFVSQGYWIFLAQATPLYIPRRTFTSPDAERDFATTALSFMTEGARGRSPQAAKLASQQAPYSPTPP